MISSKFTYQQFSRKVSRSHPYSFLSLLTPFLLLSSFLATILTLSAFTAVNRPAVAPMPSQHFKEAVPSITAVSSYPGHIKIRMSVSTYVSIRMHMCLMFSVAWFCPVSVPVMLFKCNVIPVNYVRAGVHSCIQKQELRCPLFCFPYSLLNLSCNWVVMMLRSKDSYTALLSNHSLILLILSEVAARWWQH